MSRTFRPKLSLVLGAFVIGLAFLGFAIFAAIGLIVRPVPPSSSAMNVPFIGLICMFSAFGLYFIYGAAVSSATVEIDDEGLTYRALWGRTRLLWRCLARADVTGTGLDDFELRDTDGRHLEISGSALQDGYALTADLQARTAALREAMVRGWRNGGARLRPSLPFLPPLLATLLVISALFVYGAFACYRMPSSAADGRLMPLLSAAGCVAGALFFLWVTAIVGTRVLTLTHDAVVLEFPGYRRAIPYTEIDSIGTREFENKGVSQQITTIRARSGKRILLTSYYPNYPEVIAYLRERAGSAALDRGAGETRRETKRQERQAIILLGVLAPILVVMLFGAPVLIQRRAAERLANYNRIGALGVPTEARITDKTIDGGKSAEYVLEYMFHVPGRRAPVHGASPVRREVWESSQAGQTVTALYIPDHPETCRLTISESGEIARRQAHSSAFYYAINGLVVVLIAYIVVRAQMRRSGKWTGPPVPAAADLSPDALLLVRREVRRIGIARAIGMRTAAAAMAVFMVMGVVMLILGVTIPAVNRFMSGATVRSLPGLLIFSPAYIAVGGALVLAPLGELYAYLRTKALQNVLADPRLAPDLVQTLRLSTVMEPNLGGATSLRLLNALTSGLKSAAVTLPENQRHFLYRLAEKWKEREDWSAFVLALLAAISGWSDEAGLALARRIARTATLRPVREAGAIAAGEQP